jgi:hypothetical protein
MNKKYNLISLAVLLIVMLAGCSAVHETPAPIPPELSIEEHTLTRRPEAEYTQLYFAESTPEGILAKHAGDREQSVYIMDQACMVGNQFGQCVAVGNDQFTALGDSGSVGDRVSVTVARNGSPIYNIPAGVISPINSVQGLWVYGNHWALETAYVTTHQTGNEIDSQATGQISMDGQLINKQYGYQEAFGFQTMHGKPFYFFKRHGKIGISYNSVEILLGYAEVLHYGCCSGATLNPRVAQNMVAYFARKGNTWYYVEIGVFGQPAP